MGEDAVDGEQCHVGRIAVFLEQPLDGHAHLGLTLSRIVQSMEAFLRTASTSAMDSAKDVKSIEASFYTDVASH